MKRHEMYEVNVDKFADLMMRHYQDNGVDTMRLCIKAMQGEDIRPLAMEFIADRLKQCMEAWECAAGVWRLGDDGEPERNCENWVWDKFEAAVTETLDKGLVL